MFAPRRPFKLSLAVTKLLSREILGGFALGTAVFLLIMLMFQAIRLSEFLVVHSTGFQDILKISANLLLSFLPIAIPVAFLFSVLMGISRANSDGEILALHLAGFSKWNIFLPLAVFSALISLVAIYLSMYSVPNANRRFELIVGRIDGERVLASLRPGVFTHGFHGLVLFAEQISPTRHLMNRVFIYDNREASHPLAITARDGVLHDFPSKGTRTLRLRDGTIYLEKPWTHGNQQKIDFRIYDINLELDNSANFWRDYSAPSYTYPHLKSRMQEAHGDATLFRRLEVELHRRYAMGLSVIVFAVLGFAIGCRSHKGVRSSAIVLCLIVSLLYWLAYLAAAALSSTGAVLPWLGIWMPNLLLLGVGVLIFRRAYY